MDQGRPDRAVRAYLCARAAASGGALLEGATLGLLAFGSTRFGELWDLSHAGRYALGMLPAIVIGCVALAIAISVRVAPAVLERWIGGRTERFLESLWSSEGHVPDESEDKG